MTPLAEEIKKLIDEIKNINTKIKNITEDMKSYSKKKYIEALENNLNEKIYSIDNLLDSKYLKKSDFQKIVKTIDIQIKQLQGNNTNTNNNSVLKQEGENWLLAKQPIKCFNCASCEAKVSNTLQQNEFLPWNKYHGQYRIGQGFSNLLKKLNKRNFEEKELNQTEKRARLFDFSFENIGANNIIMMNNKIEKLKINNRFIEDRISFPMSVKKEKYKFPKIVKNLRKKQKSLDTIPLSDEEKEEKSVEDDGSPKILKITKLKNEESTNTNNFNANNNVKNKTGRNNENNNLNRVQSFPLY
jgi:hypothetical protein